MSPGVERLLGYDVFQVLERQAETEKTTRLSEVYLKRSHHHGFRRRTDINRIGIELKTLELGLDRLHVFPGLAVRSQDFQKRYLENSFFQVGEVRPQVLGRWTTATTQQTLEKRKGEFKVDIEKAGHLIVHAKNQYRRRIGKRVEVGMIGTRLYGDQLHVVATLEQRTQLFHCALGKVRKNLLQKTVLIRRKLVVATKVVIIRAL